MPDRNEWRVQYLRVIGRLYPDGRLRLRPGYLTELAPTADRVPEDRSPLMAELLDVAGEALGRYALRVYSTCSFGGGAGTQAVRAWLPFHPETRTVRFLHRGRMVAEIRRRSSQPEIRLRWQPGDRVEGSQRIVWDTADSGEDAALEFFLRYSHDGGRRWQRIGWRTVSREAAVNFDELPGGDRCLVAVVATDGINTAIAHSEPFRVEPKACHAFILAPIDGSRLEAGQPAEFAGQGYWMEERRAEHEALRWTSSLDGELGRGSRLFVSRLSEGEHRITLTAGEQHREGRESITIHVGRSDTGTT